MTENKKGLVFIHGPKILLDFLCFYCDCGSQYMWTIICTEGHNMDSDTIEACHRAGIFEDVLLDMTDYSKQTAKEKMSLFFKMLCCAVFGRKKQLCRKIIAEETPIVLEEYEIVVVPTDYRILSGAFLQFADRLEVAILDDGRGDYIERKWRNFWKNKPTGYEIQGFLLAMLGYANPAKHYPLRSTRRADKYARYPDELPYRKYKSIYGLDFHNERYKGDLDRLVSKTFLVPEDANFFRGDVLLFTSYFDFYTDDETEALNTTIAYINQNYRGEKVIIKKHPADKKEYVFDPSIEVVEIDKHVPGELLATKIDVKECIYMFPSTLLDEYMNVIEDYKIMYYDCLKKSKNAERDYDQAFQSMLKDLSVDQEKIIHL